MLKKTIMHVSVFFSLLCVFGGCVTQEKTTHRLPQRNEFPGYRMVDAVDKDEVSLGVSRDDRVVVFVRDIATTSYSYLEPRYNNSMVQYEGQSNCCLPSDRRMGNTGLSAYKFSFIGLGETKIQLVSRHKGASITANHLDDDHVVTIRLKVTR